jgi:hypothetical protein
MMRVRALDDSFSDTNRGFIRRTQETEVKEALEKDKRLMMSPLKCRDALETWR